jgi:hypothetical protein
MVAHYERADAASGAHRWHTCKLATAVVALVALNAALYLVRGDAKSGNSSAESAAASSTGARGGSSADQFGGTSDDGERADFSAFALFLDFAVDSLRAAHAALSRFESGESSLVAVAWWPVLAVATAILLIVAVVAQRRRRPNSAIESAAATAESQQTAETAIAR